MAIISVLEKSITFGIDGVDASVVKRIFNMRYCSGLKSLSKFESIGARVGKSGQTVRSIIMRVWSKLAATNDLIKMVSSEISSAMNRMKKSSVQFEHLSGSGAFARMSRDDVSSLIHDMCSYVALTKVNFFIVRHHGESMASVFENVDDLVSNNNGNEPLESLMSIPEKAISCVQRVLANGVGLSQDLLEILPTINQTHAKILEDRIGISTGQSKTLSEVGDKYKVTRERIRQTTNIMVKRVLAAESISGGGPLLRLISIVNEFDFGDLNVAKIDDLIESSTYLSGFKGNAHGLFLILAMCDVDNIVQSSGFYLHDQDISKDHALHDIAALKSSSKKKKGKDAMHQMMAVLPLSVIEAIRLLALEGNTSSNTLYGKIISDDIALNVKTGRILQVDWKEVGTNWRMVNMRLQKNVISGVSTKAVLRGTSRASLVYTMIKDFLAKK